MPYAVVIEQRGSLFRAYVPDLPGCTATGSSLAEAESAVRAVVRGLPAGDGIELLQAGQSSASVPPYLRVRPAD